MNNTRRSGCRANRRDASAGPVKSGIITSVSSRWIGEDALSYTSMASDPPLATSTSNPAPARMTRTRFRTVTSSSTTRMVCLPGIWAIAPQSAMLISLRRSVPLSAAALTRLCPPGARFPVALGTSLTRAGHQVVGYDRDAAAVKKVIERGGLGADSLPALARQLQPRRAIWIMVPAGDPVDQTIQALLPHLAKGDILIDGGNSNYKDSQRRGAELKAQGFEFLDVGTSGGIWGLREGYSMMIGGDGEAVSWLRPIFEALAPAADKGWGHVGPSGAGHFVKMVHNGIE